MQPNASTEITRDAAERQSNYLILSSLQQKLSPELFQQILTEIRGSMKLPGRMGWDGKQTDSTFQDLKISQSHLNGGFLTGILQSVNDLRKQSQAKETQIQTAKNLKTLLKQNSQKQNIYRTSLFARLHSHFGKTNSQVQKAVDVDQFSRFQRMKTIFCHADHSTDEVSSIFNVQFDRTGKLIVSGADDGILKVWDRDSLTLQASLHGHDDFIIDIGISKCNKFIASSGKDAQVIIWDLQMGKIIKRLNDHQQQINRVIFVSPKFKEKVNQTPQSAKAPSYSVLSDLNQPVSSNSGIETSVVKNQFLLTCSDDGTVFLYDFSPFSREQKGDSQRDRSKGSKAEYDEFKVRRSGRRVQADSSNNNQGAQSSQEILDIFKVQLTPDDYRPGMRNKKLDTIVCSSQGVVIAGTSTGEVFVWKLNFTDITKRNTHNCAQFVGQFKIYKNAGVQFAEFSPTSDILLLGSTDGIVKIYKIELPPSKSKEQQTALKAFNMSDSSRLEISIDEKNGCHKTESITYFDEQTEEKVDYMQAKIEVTGQVGFGKPKEIKFTKSQCDAVKWSINGRFAIASITSQIDYSSFVGEDGEICRDEICRIKIWDTVNETFHDDLARPSGCQLKKNSWVLAPHPIVEELLMTGSDGGSLILWNIETKQILNKFLQYGVYSIDGYVMDNPLDGKFSVDGKAFVCGNQLGTISLFSCENVSSQYEATRVQQFFQYDCSRDTNNPFERVQNRPQICGYNMIPHDQQPARSLIGRFTKPEPISDSQQVALIEDKEMDTEDKMEIDNKMRNQIEQNRHFETKLSLAKHLGITEEQYYRDQIESRIRESYQPFVLEQGRDRLESFHESTIEVNNEADAMQRGYSGMYNEEQSLVNALSPQSPLRPQRESVLIEESPVSQSRRLRAQASGQRRQVGADQRQGRRRLQRTSARALRDMPEVEYQSDTGVEAAANQSASVFSQDESSSSVSLDDEEEPEQRRFEVRRQNMHDTARTRRNQQMEDEQREDRAARARRRNRREAPDSDQEDDGGRRTGRSGRVLRRPNYTEQSPGISLTSSPEADTIPTRRSRGRPSNAELQRREGNRLQGRSQDRANRRAGTEQLHSQVGGLASSSRSRRNQRVLQDSSIDSHDRGGIRSTRQNLRQLVDNSASSRHEEELKSGQKQVFDSHNQMIRECGNFLSDREESTANNFNAEQQIVESDSSEERLSKPMVETKATQPDEDYEQILNLDSIKSLLPADFDPIDKKCTLCNRKDEPIAGPFCKFKDDKRTSLVGRPLYFHQDCIEINKYSSFKPSLKKWVNIGTMLDNLVHKTSHFCYRCKTKGASVQCFMCLKQFHGFKCAKLFTHQFPGEEGEPSSYQCMFCVNEKNHEERVSQGDPNKDASLVRSQEYLNYLKDNIQKKHILATKNHVQLEQLHKKAFTYSPQALDLVYYFFQGHEEYMFQYSCHFFSGLTVKYPKNRTMPWMRHKQLTKKEFVLCKIDQIEILFPSERSINLMKLYPDSTSVSQTPQLIQRLHLIVVQGYNNDKGTIRFTVDLFPNSLPDFLVLQTVFERKYEKYIELMEKGSLVGKTFQVLNKNSNSIQTKRIVNDYSPCEPSVHPKSLWLNIKVADTSSSRGGIGRVSEMPQHRSSRRRDQTGNQNDIADQDTSRINFWDIQFGDEANAIIRQMSIFQPEERVKLVNVLNDFCEKQQEFIIPFLDRVPLDVAADYRSIIAGEMYFNLVRSRIENGYYRSQQSLLSDIDLISYNAKIYNGEDHNIHVSATNLCEKVRVKLCTSMFMKGDAKWQQQTLANSAKIVPPSKLKMGKKQEDILNSKEQLKDPAPQKIGLVEEEKEDEVMKEITPSDSGKKTAEPTQLINTRTTRRNASGHREQEEDKSKPNHNGSDREIVIEIDQKTKPKADGSSLVKIQIKGKSAPESAIQDKQKNQMTEKIGRRRGRQAAGGLTTQEIEEKVAVEATLEQASNAHSSEAVSANDHSEDQQAAKNGIRKKLRKRQKVE